MSEWRVQQGASVRSRPVRWLLVLMISFSCSRQIVIAQPQRLPKHELWKIHVNGTGLEQIAIKPGFICGSPVWSPDGKWIAFDTQRAEEGLRASQIAIIRADGTGLQHLGPGAIPSWSPEGQQIVMHTYGTVAGESPGIYVMDRDGSNREMILDHWGGPRWIPRSNRIASVNSSGALLILDLETGVEKNVLPGKYFCRAGFGVSPDGHRYSFGNQRSGIGIATLDEEKMQASVRLFVPNGSCNYSSWSPDGKRIVYSWHLDESTPLQLYLYDVDSDKPPVLLPGQDAKRVNGSPDWSPDGKTIVFVSHIPEPK